MGINQAIFTSSARGIAKGGGLGIHTYNQLCSEIELSEFEQSFCKYQYKDDRWAIAELPRKMMFRKIDDRHYMQAAVSYLGKDYNRELGRMGNLLSHMFSFEKSDIKCYPMQLYGSLDFRYSMNQEEVDGSRETSYLPELREVRPGSIVTVDTVQEFLGRELWRTDFFCHLVAAVLHRDAIHKVIIYDRHENIIMWLAAVEYALPLQCAVEISFSSYEEDPTISEFDIRGAVCGLSAGDCEEYQSGGQFYIFDGVAKKYPEFDISADYFQDGLQTCMAYAYESLQGFHQFMKNYNYQKADMDLCAGFKLFQLVQSGMDVLEESEFHQAVSFESRYGGKRSYQLILKELLEKLAVSPVDTGLLRSIYIWLAGYFEKDLNIQEWNFAVICAVKLENYGAFARSGRKEKEQVWELIYKTSMQKEKFMLLAKQLQESGLYQNLGKLSAYAIRQSKEESVVKLVKQIFLFLWKPVPQNTYKYFDLSVEEAAVIIRGYEEEEKYEKALLLFLNLQDLGKGEIAGAGMDKILYMVSDGTNLEDIKLRKSGIWRRRKEDGELELMQTKCAFEAFNYVQKNGKDLPIEKIRLLHLGRCILKAYEENKPLEGSKALEVYSNYPVAAEKIGREEFESYMMILCESMVSIEITREDYMQLLTYWILSEKQKNILMQMFLSSEMDKVRKKEQIQGLAALLAAVKSLKDEEYAEALILAVLGMKNSQREKIAGLMKSKLGIENKSYQYWREIETDSEKPGKGKKGFFSFGKR